MLVRSGDARLPLPFLATLHKELEAIGYTTSATLDERLQTLERDAFASFFRNLLKSLREIKGANVDWRPLYPDFPDQVVNASEAELFWNALSHYRSSGRWRPATSISTRADLAYQERRAHLQEITLGSQEHFDKILSQLVGARSSLSMQDKEDVAWFVRQYGPRTYELLPATIHSRENLAILGAALLRNDQAPALEFLGRHIQSATDLLRLGIALSGGDVSLATPSKFCRMNRSLRKWILATLESRPNLTEDLFRHSEPFKRFAEVLHPGDYKNRFSMAFEAFAAIRNGLKPETFNSRVEHLLEANQTSEACTLLATRPGELTRRLDQLLRKSGGRSEALERFESVKDHVATPVLLQTLAHFRHRNKPRLRTFFPKGETAKVFATVDTRPGIEPATAMEAARLCEQALVKRFSTLAPLGRCYVDPALANFTVPSSQRSAAKALRTIARGSRLPLPRSKIIRLFLWWKNGKQRTDIDLSAALYDANFKYLDVLSYYNLKNYGGCHSGDVVDAPLGASEFIDLDVERIGKLNARFIVASINSYTNQSFCDLPECFAGWMARNEAGSGEVFEPATVIDKIDIASESTICLPVIFDLQELQIIWSDIALEQYPAWNNVQNNLSGVSLMLRALVQQKKPDLHTLFGLHAKARGVLVESAEDAETVFAVKDGITPFDLDRIRADFM